MQRNTKCGMIRCLSLVLDASQRAGDRDWYPTLFDHVLKGAQRFVAEYYEQNPISQLGCLAMRDGVAERVSDMSGHAHAHLARLRDGAPLAPRGEASLQNALLVARAQIK